MWELDYKESWAQKNWCFWSVVLEKMLDSPLDCKEIQPVHPKGDQSWVFIGRWGGKEWDTTEWLEWTEPGESPAIQWLGLSTLTDRGPGSIPCQGILQATQSGQKQNKINSLPGSREHWVTIKKEESV